MRRSPLVELSKNVSDDCICICSELNNIKEYIIANQLKKSCTSIGANIGEAIYAESKKDFIHKLHIAAKECNESIYWIKIIRDNNVIEDNKIKSMYNKCFSIKRMLSASINTAKKTLSQE